MDEDLYDHCAGFHKKIEEIPIANLATRLEWLNDVARSAQRSGHTTALMDAMHQAAEDIGGAFTNRRHISGEVKGGCFVVPGPVSAEDWVAAVAPAQATLSQNAKTAAEAATKTGAKK